MSVYNGERYLHEQLESICKQDCKAQKKCVIRDDGSSDKTFQIIDQFKNYIDIEVIKGENIGPAASFWNLVERTDDDSDFYAFADQDDVWDPNKLSVAIERLSSDAYEGKKLYFANAELVDSNLNSLGKKVHEEKLLINLKEEFICGMAMGCTMVMNRETFYYLQNVKIKTLPMHDFIAFTYVCAVGKIIYDENPRMKYRQHNQNVIGGAGKNIFLLIRDKMKTWLKNKEIMSGFANDMLKNLSVLKSEDGEFLLAVANYRKNIKKWLQLLLDDYSSSNNKRGVRSFRLRVLFRIY